MAKRPKNMTDLMSHGITKVFFSRLFGKVKLKGVNELFIFSRDIIPFGKLRRKLNEQMFN